MAKAFPLAYTSLLVSSKSEERPPSLLTEGDGTVGWRTDLPTDRATLVLDLGDLHDVTAVTIRPYLCTHVEIRATPTDPRVPTEDKHRDAVLLPVTQLVTMYLHKQLMAPTTALLKAPSTLDGIHVVDPRSVRLPIHTAAGRHCRYLLVTVLCLWEPRSQIGLDHIEIWGTCSTGPAPKPVVVTDVHTGLPHLTAVPASAGELRPTHIAAPAPSLPPKSAPPPPPPPPSILAAAGGLASSDLPTHSPRKPKPVKDSVAVSSAPVPLSSATSVPPAAPAVAASPSTAADPSTVLRHCVCVLSGYVNPARAEIRDKALSLGAKVQADWGPNCTHLICATVGTPKYLEVSKSSHGTIVSKDWIADCWAKKKRARESDYYIGDGGPDAVASAPPPGPGGAGSCIL